MTLKHSKSNTLVLQLNFIEMVSSMNQKRKHLTVIPERMRRLTPLWWLRIWSLSASTSRPRSRSAQSCARVSRKRLNWPCRRRWRSTWRTTRTQRSDGWSRRVVECPTLLTSRTAIRNIQIIGRNLSMNDALLMLGDVDDWEFEQYSDVSTVREIQKEIHNNCIHSLVQLTFLHQSSKGEP